MENGTLLTFISTYRPGMAAKSYTVENTNTEFKGAQTNDAPTKYLVHQAQADQHDINTIICLVTEESRKQKDDGESAYSNFVNNIAKYLREKKYENVQPIITNDFADNSIIVDGETIVIKKIEVDEKIENTEEKIEKIYRRIAELSEKNDYYYIDCSGGMRDINFLMLAILRFLEYNNKICAKSVYSEYNQDKDGILHPLDRVYSMFSIINAVDEFVTTGSAVKLMALKEKEDNVSDDVSRLISSLNKFSENMNISYVEEFQNNIEEIKKCIEECKKNETDSNLFSSMVRGLVKTIENKMPLSDENNILDWVDWCVKNGMIQQAATLYTEKIFDDYSQMDIMLELLRNKEKDYKNVKEGYEEKDIEKISKDFKSYYDAILPIGINLRKKTEKVKSIDLSGNNTKKTIKRESMIDAVLILKRRHQRKKIVIETAEENNTNGGNNIPQEYKLIYSQNSIDYKEEIARILEYYTCIKELRNCMNHASDLLGKLAIVNEKFKRNLSREYQSIRNLLKEAINENIKFYSLKDVKVESNYKKYDTAGVNKYSAFAFALDANNIHYDKERKNVK